MFQQQIERGTAFLDSEMPGWEVAIDLERLDMSYSMRCILGQLYVGGYLGFLLEYDRTVEWADEHGFTLSFPDAAILGWFEQLTQEWAETIRKRKESGGSE